MDGRDETWPVMLAGVFNVFPLGPVYQWIVGQDNFGECFRLMSAYQFYQSGQEPAFTCYNHLLKNTVDYIFFSSSRFQPVQILQTMPESVAAASTALPSEMHPSDHVPLKVVLRRVAASDSTLSDSD
mmetsp:Transcript_23700/g.53726  ORF Transcript_23700/g.53726 Transcript_23700/m.53726 type:complete len:127 (+) Transcript_23700:937-1317(+)